MRRAYRFRAYPTRRQEQHARAMLDAHRQLYNAALEERREAWRHGVRVRYRDQSAQLSQIRRADPDGQGRWSFTSQQQTLRRLDRAFHGFFQRVQAGRKAGYPRFKSAARWQSVEFVDGDGARWRDPEGRWARAYFQGVGQVKVTAHRPVVGRVKTLRCKREGRRWYVIVVAEQQPVPLPATGREVGLDVGVARFATTSDGHVIGNPRLLAASARELSETQRTLAGCRPGSGNRRRAKRKLARLHRKVANRRRDFHHQTAKRLVDTCDTIAVEALNISGMTGSASGTLQEPGRNVAAKAGLNRSILDAGWGQFLVILLAKAEGAGRRVITVNPRDTSITCHQCGAHCTRPRQDIVVCPTHGGMDADLNGACNIFTRAGLGSGRAA
jgi:putative transposase